MKTMESTNYTNLLTNWSQGNYESLSTNLSDSWGDGEYGDLLEEFRTTLFTHREPGAIVLICSYVPMFVLAFLGNLLVLLVVLPNKQMRSVTNCFIVNMALSDLLVTVICIPMAIGQSVYRFWVYGEFMCKITNYIQGVAVAADAFTITHRVLMFAGVAVASSVFTITALSVDRYLAIRHPMTFRAFSSGHHAWKVVLIIWLLSFCSMIPLILVRQLQVMDIIPTDLYYFCNEIWPYSMHRQIYDGILFICLFIIPGCFVTTSYCRIGCQLWIEEHTLYHTDSAHGRRQAERVMIGRRRVARMLIIVALLFAVCWIPYHLLAFYIDFTKLPHQTALKVLPFTILLGHSNSAINPILYCFMHRNFRKCLFKHTLCCRKKPRWKLERHVQGAQYNKARGAMRQASQYTRHPLIRTSSNTSSRSSTSSLKFSSGSWRCHTKSTYIPPQNIPMKAIRSLETFPGSLESETLLTDSESRSSRSPPWKNVGEIKAGGRTRREIFNYSLDIPTTINEESQNSSSPRTEIKGIRPVDDKQTTVSNHVTSACIIYDNE